MRVLLDAVERRAYTAAAAMLVGFGHTRVTGEHKHARVGLTTTRPPF